MGVKHNFYSFFIIRRSSACSLSLCLYGWESITLKMNQTPSKFASGECTGKILSSTSVVVL